MLINYQFKPIETIFYSVNLSISFNGQQNNHVTISISVTFLLLQIHHYQIIYTLKQLILFQFINSSNQSHQLNHLLFQLFNIMFSPLIISFINYLMKPTLPILCFVALLSLSTCFNLFNKVQLTKANGAMCMDGSNFAIYTYIPDQQKPANKLLIFFEQIWQGWCVQQDLNKTLTDCYKYVNNSEYMDFGSSKNYTGDLFFMEGIIATDSIFKDYYKVYVKSCDGGAYFGQGSVKIKNQTLNFRGTKNFHETMNYMKNISFIQDRDEVVLVGMENGALAALAWADYVKANTKGKVRVILDSGMWENDINDKTKDNYFQKRMKTMGSFWLSGSNFPNTKCQAASQDSIQKCFYASQLVKHIDPSVDIFFLQSYYDGWALTQILGLECTQEFASLSECTQEHRDKIQNYHLKISGKLHEMVQLPNVAALGISCVAHFFTKVRWDDENFSVPEGKNNTAVNLISRWLANKSQRIYLDDQPWPHNTNCSRKVVVNSHLLSEQ